MEPAPHLTSDLWSPIGHSDVVEMGGGGGVKKCKIQKST